MRLVLVELDRLLPPQGYQDEVKRRARFAAAMILRNGGRNPVLDLGAFRGDLATFLPSDWAYLGYDLAENPENNVQRFDLNNLPLPTVSGLVSTVAVLDVFEHIKEPDALLRECARVLAPGGLALFSFPNESGIKAYLMRAALLQGDMISSTWGEQSQGWRHLWYFTRKIAREFVQEGGIFEVKEERPYFGRTLARVPLVDLHPGWATCFMFACRKRGSSG